MKSRFLVLLILVSLVLSFSIIGYSTEVKDFPSKSLKLVVTWPAGGGTDLALRMITKYVEKELGQDINIQNIAGGGGAIGYQDASERKADGYTLVAIQFDILTVEAQGLAPVSYRDFDMVMLFAEQPVVFAVQKDSPWETLEDFVDEAKINSGLNIGGASIGGVWHQAATLAKKELGVEFNYVPYAGLAELLPALLGKHIEGGFIFLTGAGGQLRSGDIRILGIMAPERLKEYPDVPTFREMGFDVMYSGFYGVAAPKGIPAEHKTVLEEAFYKAFNNPNYQKELTKIELSPNYMDGATFTKYLGELYPDVETIVKSIMKIK